MYVSPVLTGPRVPQLLPLRRRVVAGAAWCRSWRASPRPLPLALGLRAIATPAVALAGAWLLAVNFTWVMYSRVALLEATMVAGLVASWACYARAERDWRWGLAAAGFGLLAFFTKASAAFFLIALGLDACWGGLARVARRRRRQRPGSGRRPVRRLPGSPRARSRCWPSSSCPTGSGLSVLQPLRLRVPALVRWASGPLLDRASWFPVVHGFFTRQWLLSLAALAGLAAVLVRYPSRLRPASALWRSGSCSASAEFVLHDLGNERRYVFLIPPMAGLAALTLVGDRRLLAGSRPACGRAPRWCRAGAAAAGGPATSPGAASRARSLTPDIRMSVRVAALAAVVTAGVMLAAWAQTGARAGARPLVEPAAGGLALALIAAVNLAVFWPSGGGPADHEELRRLASRSAVLLPPGTLGARASSPMGSPSTITIRPLFIGPGFGNYADRLERPDVAWILTYSRPRLGYEGAVVRDLLDAMPGWSTQVEVPVAETRAETTVPC